MSFQVFDALDNQVINISLINGKELTGLSSTTPLPSGELYTSDSVDISDYPAVAINVITDQDGVLYAQFSSDSINWDYQETYNYMSGEKMNIVLPVRYKYFRIVFDNSSASDQTYLRIQALAGSQQIEGENGKVSMLNSSSDILLDTETFTGAAEDVSEYSTIVVSTYSSHNGTLQINFSSDGTNWDSTNSYAYTAGVSLVKKLTVVSKYLQVIFLNNSGGDQTAFRLQTLLGFQQIDTNVTLDTSGLAQAGRVSTINSTSVALNNGETFTGNWEDVSAYPAVTVACYTDTNCALYVDFSTDQTNADSILTYEVDANINEVHRITTTRKYFRIRITNNSGVNQTFLRASSMFGQQTTLTAVANSLIQDDADTILSRSILTGQVPSGRYQNVGLDPDRNLRIGINYPLNPFGSVHTEANTPIFQTDAVYGINPLIVFTGSTNGGSASVTNSTFDCSTSTDPNGSSFLQSRKRLRYRPGQGSIISFTAKYSTPATNSYQIAGMGHPEDGFYFGYKDTDFGILYVKDGQRAVYELTILGTLIGTANIQLNGVLYSFPTSSTNGDITAYEIAQHNYIGWVAQWYNDGVTPKVQFISQSAHVTDPGQFSAGGSVTGTFSAILVGATTTESFIPQTTWNVDRMDGTSSLNNPSGTLLDPSKFNIYRIAMQYLGAGTLVFSMESVYPSKTHDIHPVHVINNPNNITRPIVSNPSFPFTMSAYKTAGITDITISSICFAGTVEGALKYQGPLIAYESNGTADATASMVVLMSIKNSYTFGTPTVKTSQCVINLNSLSVAARGGNNVLTTFYIIKNPPFNSVTKPVYDFYSEGKSCSLFSNTAGVTTSYPIVEKSSILFSTVIGETGQGMFNFLSALQEFDLQPGESISICARTNTSTAVVSIGLNTREDQ